MDDGSRARNQNMGHSFRKVTLTRPTFCHSCSDFIWGLLGFLCEVCNFMCHEKCLKMLRSACSCTAPSLVQVPVAHCFGPAGQKKRFCCICRRQMEGKAALRCEVCSLFVHSDCAIFSCADCRWSHLDGNVAQGTFHHHWREGNLSASARCEVCQRSCASSEVLVGMRCEWCGITSHVACYLSIPPECTMGRLSCMMLDTSCVSIDSRNFSKMHLYRILETTGQDLEPLGDSESSPPPPKDVQTATADSGKVFLKVFDGDDAAKRDNFQLASVSRAMRNEEVVAAVLRAFYLPGDPQDFELNEVGGLQHVISGSSSDADGCWSLTDGGGPWLLRAKPCAAEVVMVHAAWTLAVTSVSVATTSTAESILTEVLRQLDRQDEEVSSFSLVEVFMSSKQVVRETLLPQQNMLDKLQDIRKVSLRQMNQTRFYVMEMRNRPVQISLLIGGLPPLLTKDMYAQLIHEHLITKAHLVSISHIYSSQGAVALHISCFSEAERIYMLAKDTSINNKLLTVLVIPNILHTELREDVCPLLVFVNPKSGGLKGQELLCSFRHLLNPHQVFDVSNGGPLAGFHTFRKLPRFRVLVCGGDGTVGWILGVLEEIRHKLDCRDPSICIIPLGTGNDLARILRWGPGYSGEDPHHILVCVDEAEEVLMDRWTILMDAQDISEDDKSNGLLEPPKIVQMSNYFGLGIDAELSLDFHLAREDDPDKFSSRFHNKSVYVKVGLQKISSTRSLHKELELQVDGQSVPLPHIEGLIFLNIPSWGSGADLWGSESDGRYRKPSIDDGLLEVVGVTGVVHMGQVQSGLRSGIRIAQGSYIRIIASSAIPVQVDGEPWIQPPGHIIISSAGPKVRMLRKQKQKKTLKA